MSSEISNSISTVVHNANFVKDKIISSAIQVNKNPEDINLVAVSKTKPIEDIQELYQAGYRCFGENYYQELVEKAAILPKDIKWHFIGHLQSSKASKIIKDVPHLDVVETVDTKKLASKLNAACESANRPPLDVFVQVDTSGEITKSGVSGIDKLSEESDNTELLELVLFITQDCPRLRFKGLMTIGAPGDLTCFDRLVGYRQEVADKLAVDPSLLALSMGMSCDFQEAILRGATSVRVGSTIFGERIYPQKSSS